MPYVLFTLCRSTRSTQTLMQAWIRSFWQFNTVVKEIQLFKIPILYYDLEFKRNSVFRTLLVNSAGCTNDPGLCHFLCCFNLNVICEKLQSHRTIFVVVSVSGGKFSSIF